MSVIAYGNGNNINFREGEIVIDQRYYKKDVCVRRLHGRCLVFLNAAWPMPCVPEGCMANALCS